MALEREKGYEKVRSLLRAALDDGEPILVNEINVGEVFYITARRSSFDLAEELLVLLGALPVRIIGNPFSLVIEAARIKAQFAISHADAFAVATAIDEDAAIVTGDPEFRLVEQKVSIDWI